MDKSKCVKILQDALKKVNNSIPALHSALIKNDVKISLNALYKAQKGEIKEFKWSIVQALGVIAYNGDQSKIVQAMDTDIKNKSKS